MNCYVIPEIAGRLLVGPDPDVETFRRPEITFFMDVDPLPGFVREYVPANSYIDSEEDIEDLDRRVNALKWFWEKSQTVGSVFYIFTPPRAWEMAAMALMARWGWTRKKCAETIGQLDALNSDWTPERAGIDLGAAEKAYQAWLERGTAQR